MKLTDISATRGSRAATAKLARQVQKATVAAGKEPRMDLSVLGISIGQTQSTGDTSRVVPGTALGGTKKTPMIRRQVGPVNESVSGHDAWDLLEQLGDAINYRLVQPHKADVAFDKAEVADAAIQIMRLYGEGDKNAVNNICHVLSMVRTRAPGAATGNMEAVLNAKRTLEDFGFTPFHELKTLLDAASTFEAFANNVTGNLEMIQETVDFLENCYLIATKEADHPHRVSFCRAALKHLGILK
jgi:hypothetical protein